MKKVYLKTPEAVIKALKEGKEVRDDDGYLYKIIDGFIVSKRKGECKGSYLVGDCISSRCSPYIIEKEPLEIKVGKFYETRDHRKARCYLINDSYCFFTVDNYTCFDTNKRGRRMGKEAHSLDIIGPWKEEK